MPSRRAEFPKRYVGKKSVPHSRPPARPGGGIVNESLDIARLRPLGRTFFDRNPRQVARDLLGKILVRSDSHVLIAGRIVETEAYLGAEDAAAHAAAGKTQRNLVLWGPPGHAYVYFIYGNYYCLNVSCLPPGTAGCVLFRALEPLAGLDYMAQNRGLSAEFFNLRLLSTGPGRLCEALAITRARDNGADMTSRRSGLWIAEDGYHPAKIITTPRVGITKSVAAPLRYLIAENPYVSAAKNWQ